MANIYESASGDRLVDPVAYSDNIRRYLRLESVTLQALLPTCSALVEVGCMGARSLQEAESEGVKYLGIEPAANGFAQGISMLSSSSLNIDADIVQASAEQLHELNRELGISPIAFYPFNVIGNIWPIEEALLSLFKSGFDFMIGTYLTNREMTESRAEYYALAGIEASHRSSEVGEIFESAGFRSVAPHVDVLCGLVRSAGLPVHPFTDGKTSLFLVSSELAPLMPPPLKQWK